MATDAPAGESDPAASGRSHPVGAEAVGIVVGLTAVLTVLFIAFALPAVKSGPHDVPLGVAGPAEAVAQVEQGLAGAAPGAFDVRGYRDEQALRAAILDRDIYGGVAPGPQGVRVFIASAASLPIAQGITNLANNLAAQTGTTPTIEDLKPLPPDDPRGGGLTAAGLPLTLGGILPAVVLIRRFPERPWLRVGAATAFALLAGFAVAAILKYWFGTVTGAYVPIALGLSLGIGAISLTLLGLESVAGWPGFGLGAAVMVLLGNPLSGIAAGPEFLPSGWGAFGQLLPPGANGTLLRSTGYFEGAGATRPTIVLAIWVLAGLLLCSLAAAMRSRSRRAAEPVPS
ncbi:MAG TPA: ABC transporter permease [Actinomycetes bacterium]|nr:ABC transporter permease [Actinomycetes bacterium]